MEERSTRITTWSNRPIAFAESWGYTALTGAILGAVLASILILLQPFDTFTHESPNKNLELAGYAPLILLATLLIHIPERGLYRAQQRRWRVWQEAVAILLGALLMLIFSYLYNSWVINGVEVGWLAGWRWIKSPGSSFLLFMAPLWLYLRARFGVREAALAQPVPVTIVGENKSEQLRIRPADFVYAQSQQNYADIHYRTADGGTLTKEILRITLADLNQQLPSAQRVHRSFLVNLSEVEKMEGNARKRTLTLRDIPEPIPLSQKYYRTVKRGLANSSR